MADLSLIPALEKQSGGGGGNVGGTSDYNDLANRPVTNINGSEIVVSSLSTGVYNISGSWKMTKDDTTRSSFDDDLFYVLRGDAETRLTLISAGSIKVFQVPNGGTAKDIVEDEVAMTGDISDQLVGTF